MIVDADDGELIAENFGLHFLYTKILLLRIFVVVLGWPGLSRVKDNGDKKRNIETIKN